MPASRSVILLTIGGAIFALGYYAGSHRDNGGEGAVLRAIEAQGDELHQLRLAALARREENIARVTCAAPPTAPASATPTAAPSPKPSENPAPEATPEVGQTIRQTETLLDDAFARRQWTPSDAQSFHVAVSALPAPERERLVLRLITAINAQKLAVSTVGPPF